MTRLANDPLAQALGLKAQKATGSLTMSTPLLRNAILKQLRDVPAGLGAERLAHRLGGLDVLSVRRRLSELHKDGLIQQSGRYEPTAMGRKEAVWEIA